jgi:hypothetical protein
MACGLWTYLTRRPRSMITTTGAISSKFCSTLEWLELADKSETPTGAPKALMPRAFRNLGMG